MTGAARLAAVAARRGGAGMVTIAATGAADVYRSGEPGTIVETRPLAELLQDARRTVWVCGPGLGLADAAEAALPAAARGRAAGGRRRRRARRLRGRAGAAARRGGADARTPASSPACSAPPAPTALAAVRAAAARTGAVVLLKGGGHDHRCPGRPRRDQRQRAALARDRRRRRRARRPDRRAARAGHAGLGRGLRRRPGCMARAARRMPAPHLIAEDLAPKLPRAFADARGERRHERRRPHPVRPCAAPHRRVSGATWRRASPARRTTSIAGQMRACLAGARRRGQRPQPRRQAGADLSHARRGRAGATSSRTLAGFDSDAEAVAERVRGGARRARHRCPRRRAKPACAARWSRRARAC